MIIDTDWRCIKMKKSAFTLVEILAVIAIIGILVVGTTYGTNTVTLRNKEGQVRDDFQVFANALVKRMSSGELLSDICMVHESTYADMGSGSADLRALCFTDFGVMPVKSTVDGVDNYPDYNVNNILFNYLDGTMEDMKVQFTDGTVSGNANFYSCVKTTKQDPWNNNYSVYGFSYKKSKGTLYENSGLDTRDVVQKDVIIVYSGGKDSRENKDGDYMLIVCNIDGNTKYATVGFTRNIGDAVLTSTYPTGSNASIGDKMDTVEDTGLNLTDEQIFDAIGNDSENVTGDTANKDSARKGYYDLGNGQTAVHGFMRLGAI